MGLVQEFKDFALKGNMIELAVAVVMGKAVGDVIGALVTNVLTPLISYVTPNMDFSQWHLGKIQIGLVLNAIITFLSIALAIFFFVIKPMAILKRKEAAAPPPPPPPPSTSEVLLTEIRDLLKAK